MIVEVCARNSTTPHQDACYALNLAGGLHTRWNDGALNLLGGESIKFAGNMYLLFGLRTAVV
jgi:hypothetical protein